MTHADDVKTMSDAVIAEWEANRTERRQEREKREQIAILKADYERSYSSWKSLDDNLMEEDYEDTLQRKYEEGYSDALAMVIRLLEGEL